MHAACTGFPSGTDSNGFPWQQVCVYLSRLTRPARPRACTRTEGSLFPRSCEREGREKERERKQGARGIMGRGSQRSLCAHHSLPQSSSIFIVLACSLFPLKNPRNLWKEKKEERTEGNRESERVGWRKIRKTRIECSALVGCRLFCNLQPFKAAYHFVRFPDIWVGGGGRDGGSKIKLFARLFGQKIFGKVEKD